VHQPVSPRFLSASEIREDGLFFTDKTTFFCTLLLNIKMIVFCLLAKKDVDKSCLVVERAKYVSHVMLSVCYVCYAG